MTDNFVIRPMADSQADIDAYVTMANELNLLHDKPGDLYCADKVRDWVFGPRPAFSCLLACCGDRPVGYATFSDFFNSDAAGRGLWLGDLYVRPAHQGGGLGRQLLAAVAAEAVAREAVSLWWGVLAENTGARAFYAALEAIDEDARILELEGTPLARLAREFRAD